MSSMKIIVKKTEGELITLAVQPETTGYGVKVLVQEAEGISPRAQALMYNRVLLKDAQTLAEAGVQNNTTLLLLIVEKTDAIPTCCKWNTELSGQVLKFSYGAARVENAKHPDGPCALIQAPGRIVFQITEISVFSSSLSIGISRNKDFQGAMGAAFGKALGSMGIFAKDFWSHDYHYQLFTDGVEGDIIARCSYVLYPLDIVELACDLSQDHRVWSIATYRPRGNSSELMAQIPKTEWAVPESWPDEDIVLGVTVNRGAAVTLLEQIDLSPIGDTGRPHSHTPYPDFDARLKWFEPPPTERKMALVAGEPAPDAHLVTLPQDISVSTDGINYVDDLCASLKKQFPSIAVPSIAVEIEDADGRHVSGLEVLATVPCLVAKLTAVFEEVPSQYTVALLDKSGEELETSATGLAVEKREAIVQAMDGLIQKLGELQPSPDQKLSDWVPMFIEYELGDVELAADVEPILPPDLLLKHFKATYNVFKNAA